MDNPRARLLAVAVVLLATSFAPGADPPALDQEVQTLAAKIDQHIAARWTEAGVQPAPATEDAEFIRRVYLDLAGRVPSVAEVREFLDDKAPDKRQRIVDRLLTGPRYVTHFTNVWRALLLPEASSSLQARFLAPQFEVWLRKELAKNAGYDEMVRELLTVPVGNGQGIRVPGVRPGDQNATAFYLAKELKPENLAASTSRLFLGVKLECAQCHNHPFARWKRDQFWSYTAFFAGIQRNQQGDFVQPGTEIADKREVTIPGTDKVVQAKFLDGTEPEWKPNASARATLADWMTSADNPYFARAAANRLWGYFFGTGLIDPVDEMVGSDITASHPELLDELARQLAAHHFDLKFLMRAICTSRTYQLSSATTHPAQNDPHLFARMAVRGITPEQLFDSLIQATGYQEGGRLNDQRVVFLGNNGIRDEFVTKFGNQSDKTTEVQTSILQSLLLMNGKLMADATTLERSETLAAVVDAPFLDTNGRIEALYLAALARKPRPRELERLSAFVDKAVAGHGTAPSSAEKDKRLQQALADVFWALLNSGEFILNH